MKKYEAPIVELEIFTVGDVMTSYDGEGSGSDDNLGENDTDIL